tara:strand:+ start:49231 stop:49599 length:369 start_codon:yes stop_codon:yes gene_type:complete
MLNSRKNIFGRYLALFSVLMMFIGPALSTTFTDDNSEVICTSTGIKIVASDGVYENQNNQKDLNSLCSYCDLGTHEFQDENFSYGCFTLHALDSRVQFNQKEEIFKNLSLISYHRQAPPTKL